MSATLDRRPAATSTAVTDPPLAFARAEGVDLLGEVNGSGYRNGAALVRRPDGQMVQLQPMMYGLLEEVDGSRDLEALATAMSERVGRRFDEEHVAALIEKLWNQGLLAGSEANAPEKLNPLLALRWKVLITDPKVTRRITAPFVQLFRPWIVAPILLGFAVVVWFVLIHKGVASATAQAFNSPELLLLVVGLGIASAGLHEVGHAAACRFGGGRPSGIGAGIYVVWPAFYTDVTDAYRLPRRARLRTDLGGLYLNAVIAVVTLGVWLAVRADALLLLVALQLLEMVKQLSPIIRADGYHVLSDATGVPDLYQHIGPTLRRLLPWRARESSALTGRARALVTVWVLVTVPILISMSLTAILLLPKLAATTYASASNIVSALPDQDVPGVLASVVRLLALALPVIGSVLMAQRIVRSAGAKGHAWSSGRPGRRVVLAAAVAGLVALLAWAWWPSGQYQPVRASDNGTLSGAVRLLSSPASAARPQSQVSSAGLTPGRHLAVAMIPVGGATKEHPAFFIIKGHKGQRSAMIVSDRASVTGRTHGASSSQATPASAGATTTTSPAPTSSRAPASASSGNAASSAPTPAAGPTSSTSGAPVTTATTFPFKLPSKPGPQDSQALATNNTDGGIKYDVVYSMVTVKDGAPVDETNSAYALASCRACTTVAVSFQIVLVVGQTKTITPINIAEALNANCPSCVTTAIADQIVVTIKAQPSQELTTRLNAALQKLDGIAASGAGGSPSAIAAQVQAVQDEVQRDLDESGLLANPSQDTSGSRSATLPTPTSTTGGGTGTTPSPTSSSSSPTTPSSATTTPSASAPSSATTTPTTTTPSSTTAPSATDTTPTTTTPSSTTTTSTPTSSTPASSSSAPQPSSTP